MNNSKNAQKRIRQKALNTARKIAATKISFQQQRTNQKRPKIESIKPY